MDIFLDRFRFVGFIILLLFFNVFSVNSSQIVSFDTSVDINVDIKRYKVVNAGFADFSKGKLQILLDDDIDPGVFKVNSTSMLFNVHYLNFASGEYDLAVNSYDLVVNKISYRNNSSSFNDVDILNPEFNLDINSSLYGVGDMVSNLPGDVYSSMKVKSEDSHKTPFLQRGEVLELYVELIVSDITD